MCVCVCVCVDGLFTWRERGAVFDLLEGRIQDKVKQFVHFMNIATSDHLIDLKDGMCCGVDRESQPDSILECCLMRTKETCEALKHHMCAWYTISATEHQEQYEALVDARKQRATAEHVEPFEMQCGAEGYDLHGTRVALQASDNGGW